MSFALFQLNPIEILFLLALLAGGVVFPVIFLTRAKNRGRPLSQPEEIDRLRDDLERACDRIARLEDEVRQLRQAQTTPGEGRFTPE
jgi:hypothetical protein